MQSLEIRGLKELTAALEAAPGVIREAKAEFFEEAGAKLLADVQSRIGGIGRVPPWRTSTWASAPTPMTTSASC